MCVCILQQHLSTRYLFLFSVLLYEEKYLGQQHVTIILELLLNRYLFTRNVKQISTK